MFKFTLYRALMIAAAVGATGLLANEAVARTTQCWRCVGGWCCY